MIFCFVIGDMYTFSKKKISSVLDILGFLINFLFLCFIPI